MAAMKRKTKASLESTLNNNPVKLNDSTLPTKIQKQRNSGVELPQLSELIYCVIIAAVSLLCYWNSLPGEFVHDDIMALKDNQDLRPSTPLTEIFLNDFWGKRMSDNTSHKSYRPLCVLTFRWNYYFGELDPYGYHVVNVVLHTLVSMLFLHVCHRFIFLDIRPAFLAALMFTTHPVHTEAVTGIVGRADVMACLLFLLSFIAFLRSIQQPNPSTDFPSTTSPYLFGLSLILGACNMLIKEHGITVLGVCMVYDILVVCRTGMQRFIQSKKLTKSCYPLVKRLGVILLLLAVLMVFRIKMMHGQLPGFTDQDNPASFAPDISTRFLTYCFLLVFNGWLLLAPIILCYDWQMGSIPLVESFTDPRNMTTVFFLVTMVILCVFCLRCLFQEKRHQLKVILTGLAFLIIPFLPATNLFIRVGFVVAERILYIPSLGFCILVTHGIDNICKSCHKRALSMLCTGLVLLLAVLFTWRTIIRNPVWLTRESLFKSGVHTLPHNAKAHYNYANYLKDTGQSHDAIKHYRTTLQLYPRHASASNNLGTLLQESQNIEAEELFRKAIEIKPSHVRAHFNLANHISKHGNRKEEAMRLLQRALEIDPNYADAYTSLAGILLDRGQYDEAEILYKKVITMTPNDANAYNNYGALFVRREKREEAFEQYQKCLELDSHHTVALVNAARLLRKLGRTNEAENMFKRALEVKYEADTLKSLGALYYNTERLHKAKHVFKEVLTLEPESLEMKTNYAQVLARLNNFEDSLDILHSVIETDTTYTLAYRHLAGVYAMMKNHRQAAHYLDKFLQLDNSLDPVSKAEILYEQGSNYRDVGDKEEAIKCYQEAVKLHPKYAVAQMNLGAMYHMKNDVVLARKYYEAALKLDPDSSILKENMRKLANIEKQVKKTRDP
ncbi:protein O-mannosyl-transferase TMTC1-like [Glandiceps talaboti]